MDIVKTKVIADHIREIMKLLNIGICADNEDTPKRIAKMYQEVFVNADKSPKDIREFVSSLTTFTYTSSNLIIVKNIPFHSFCSHHWMPFFGKVDIEYIPTEKIIGLSKLPRLVAYLSHKPQLQERLTEEIMSVLNVILEPKYIKVILHDVTHTCMECRGVESVGATTDTIAERGIKP